MPGFKYWNPASVSAGATAADAVVTAAYIAADDVTLAAASEQSLAATITLATNTNVGFVVAPFIGTVTAIYSVISEALTTGDETLSFAVTGGTTMGDIVITQAASAAGDVDTLAPSANNVVAAGDTIDITTDGANGTAAIANITVNFTAIT